MTNTEEAQQMLRKRQRKNIQHENVDNAAACDQQISSTSSSSSISTSSTSTCCSEQCHEQHESEDQSIRSQIQNCTAQLAYDLLGYDALPNWLKDNPYISHGYRVEIGWRNSCHSMCHLHNETMNIWTHFIAFLLMFVLLIITLSVMSPFGHDRIDLNIIDADTMRMFNSYPGDLNMSCPLSLNDSWSDSTVHDLELNNGNCTVPEDPHIQAHRTFIQSLESYIPTSTQLTEVLERLHDHLPDIQRLTVALKQQASNLPESAAHAFLNYVDRVESHLASIRESLAVNSGLTLEHAVRLKSLISDNAAGFLQHVTMKKQVDMMRVAKSMIDDFVRSVTIKPASNVKDSSSEIVSAPGSMGSLDLLRQEGLYVKARRLFGLGDGSLRSLLSSSFEVQDFMPEQFQLHFYLTRWPVAAFMISALLCLFFSAAFHCFSAVSESWSNVFQALDYCGITLLIAGSNVPVLYYGFYCQFELAIFYISLVSLLGVACFVAIVTPALRPVRFRALKTGLFISLGFSGVIPLAHLIFTLGYVHFVVYYLLAMGGWYLLGAVFYLFHWPECWWPGKFDLWFSSHQLWHLCIVIAVLTHYVGVLQMYEWRMHTVCS